MPILSKIKSYYFRFRSYHLSTSKSILIAGAMVSMSILSGTEDIKRELDWSGRRMSDLLDGQNSYLYKINESIKTGGSVTLDKQTFDAAFEICIKSATEKDNNGFSMLTLEKERYCLNKILKTDIK